MTKTLQIAWREFQATVLTKGFIIGVLITPLMIAVMIKMMPLLMDETPPAIEGEVAVIDSTGKIFTGLADYLSPESIAERRSEITRRVGEQLPPEVQEIGSAVGMDAAQEQALAAVLGQVPQLRIHQLPPASDVEQAKQPLLEGGPKDGGRLAVVVVDPNAVERGNDGFGTYQLYVREKLDDRIEEEIQDGLRRTIVDARVRHAGLDGDRIRSLVRVPRVRSTTVTEEGERETNELFNIFLPMAFMLLLFASVLTGGQYLMTTVIEEKSSRVVEVLLSAVSPMQLMTGKILGQMAVGLAILAIYSGMGVVALISFALLGMLELSLLIYLFIFFLIAYFVIAALMAAIGAAVNELREAQTLMSPIMVTLMLPWLVWLPINRNPDSMLAVIGSFVPPLNTFVMLLRMTSSTPPPTWQVWLSIAVGVASVYAALWFAAKVFRVGLLMYGKPPTFATLVRWVRMA